MREILFRARTVKNVRWIWGDLFRSGTDPSDGEFAISYWDDEDGWMNENVQPGTIGQFTGLLDKHGKRVFEGDIIKSTNYPFMYEGKTNYLGIVSCDTHDAIGEFYVMLYVTKESEKRGISNFTNKSFYDLQMENVEVVGNIFDNKGMFRDSDEKIMKWYLED